MNTLIAFDKFKDALTASEACRVAAEALASVQPDWRIETAPLADGGDGFCQTLTELSDGEFQKTIVIGPTGEDVEAQYGIIDTAKLQPGARAMLNLPVGTSKLAIVELAQSSGIALVPQDRRSPWTTNTHGLGQTIAAARESGADAALVGLGGSATNDLALGALQALGFRFMDRHGNALAGLPTPERWPEIQKIQPPEREGDLPLRIACDVENPLLGPNGAAAIFGPQKGLMPEDLERLENETARMAELLCKAVNYGAQSLNTPGTGAAGGAAFGLMIGLGGRIVPGAELVFAWSDLEEKLARAELVITGEGRFDASSLQGKGPGALAAKARAAGKTLRVFAGSCGPLPDLSLAGLMQAISPEGMPLAQALAETSANLARCVRSSFAETI